MTTFTPRLHHFGLSVANLEETVAWYTEKLGFEQDHRYEITQPAARVAFLRLGSVWVEVFELAGAVAGPQTAQSVATDLGVQGLKHVALAVDDVDTARTLLQARGVVFVMDVATQPGPRGDRYAFFRDNTGILIELYEPHGS